MKKVILFVVAVASTFCAQAQTSCIPDFIHLSGVARTATGTPVTTFIDIKVELSQGDPANGGILKYCEQVQNIQPNNVGEFSMEFGNPTLICNPPAVLMSAVDWTTCNMWYRLSWRITGSPTYTVIATSQFSSVPYAFAARTAERVKGINTTGATTGQVLRYDGANFVPSTPSSYTAGSGIAISGGAIKTNIESASVYYINGMNNSAVYNSWESAPVPIQVTVPSSGQYLLTASGRGYRPTGGSIYMRVIDLSTNSSVGGAVVTTGNGTQGTGTFSKIVQLSANQILRMQFNADAAAANTWSFGGDATATSSITLIRLGD